MTRREFAKRAGWIVGGASMLRGKVFPQAPPDHVLEIGPCTLQVSPKQTIHTIGYNGQVPGPLLRLREGRHATIEVINKTSVPEIVHWHGLQLPSAVDGAMEEGSPMIAAGATTRYEFTARPAGFRWYHTHTFAGHDLHKAQYSGQHGFLYVEGPNNPGAYDQEVFLALHDWRGHLSGSGDGSMNPTYDISTINGRVLGFGDRLRVRERQRVLFHILNSSPTETHWLAFAGHAFQVVALDGNAVPAPQTVSMLRLAPAERVCALVDLRNPGTWVLGEVRKHIQEAGMGLVVDYAGAGSGKPVWSQPEELAWSYEQFGSADHQPLAETVAIAEEIPLVLDSKFEGHGSMEQWRINGRSYPHTESPVLQAGHRYRLRFINRSMDEHPMHLHRHSFELLRVQNPVPGSSAVPMRGVFKDVVLVPSNSESVVEFVANNPGDTLLHCHQQNHMDLGFMMVFRYA